MLRQSNQHLCARRFRLVLASSGLASFLWKTLTLATVFPCHHDNAGKTDQLFQIPAAYTHLILTTLVFVQAFSKGFCIRFTTPQVRALICPVLSLARYHCISRWGLRYLTGSAKQSAEGVANRGADGDATDKMSECPEMRQHSC